MLKSQSESKQINWGFYVWHLLHSLAVNDDSEKLPFKDKWQLIIRIINFIPCEKCKNEALSYMIKRRSLIDNNNFRLQLALYQLHNRVSKSLNKREISWKEYEDLVKTDYADMCSELSVFRCLCALKVFVANTSTDMWSSIHLGNIFDALAENFPIYHKILRDYNLERIMLVYDTDEDELRIRVSQIFNIVQNNSYYYQNQNHDSNLERPTSIVSTMKKIQE